MTLYGMEPFSHLLSVLRGTSQSTRIIYGSRLLVKLNRWLALLIDSSTRLSDLPFQHVVVAVVMDVHGDVLRSNAIVLRNDAALEKWPESKEYEMKQTSIARHFQNGLCSFQRRTTEGFPPKEFPRLESRVIVQPNDA